MRQFLLCPGGSPPILSIECRKCFKGVIRLTLIKYFRNIVEKEAKSFMMIESPSFDQQILGSISSMAINFILNGGWSKLQLVSDIAVALVLISVQDF